jgi:glutamate racemase
MNESRSFPPIGLIDSGVGGLSVLREIDAISEGLSFHYIADSAWCPYGNKPAETIIARVRQLSDYLLAKGCGSIVLACNSATIAAIESLRSSYLIPFTGMEPAVKPAAKATKTNVIGVLATEASLSGEKFHRLVDTHGKGIKVITTACPKFVELVEKGILQGQEVVAAISEYTESMLDQGADTLVLGCTHYPFLKPAIQEFVGTHIQLIDTGLAVAKRALQLHEEQYGRPNESRQQANSILIETTADEKTLAQLLPSLFASSSVKISKCKIKDGRNFKI